MTFKKLQSVLEESAAAFGGRFPLTELPAGGYASMRSPRLLPVLRFSVRRYAAEGLGNLFTMYTRGMGGLMQLATLVCTPNAGTDAPLLLVDVMAMAKKRAVFVEYYDLTAKGADCPALLRVAARYAQIADYPEKPAWYIEERAPYSLIKGGSDEAALLSMLADSVAAYADGCREKTVPRAENLAGLRAFVDRMAIEGNPSSAAMRRVLGESGAERFFRMAVMPASYTTEPLEL